MSAEGRKRREAVRRERLGLPKETKEEEKEREEYYLTNGKEVMIKKKPFQKKEVVNN